jgi:hypothetical protein
MPANNLYLKNAIERLAIGLVGLKDSENDLVVNKVQTYALPYPTEDNWVTISPFGLARNSKIVAFPVMEQVWNVALRAGVGNLGAEYGSIQQTKLWERLPIITNFITEHPHLQFAGYTDELEYLDTTIGVKIADGAVQARVERQETGDILWVQVTVQIPFQVPMKIIKYQDGQVIEVT